MECFYKWLWILYLAIDSKETLWGILPYGIFWSRCRSLTKQKVGTLFKPSLWNNFNIKSVYAYIMRKCCNTCQENTTSMKPELTMKKTIIFTCTCYPCQFIIELHQWNLFTDVSDVDWKINAGNPFSTTQTWQKFKPDITYCSECQKNYGA